MSARPHKYVLKQFREDVERLAETMYGIYTSIVAGSTSQNPPEWKIVKTRWDQSGNYREWMNSAARVWDEQWKAGGR